jgi:hypothetical protein
MGDAELCRLRAMARNPDGEWRDDLCAALTQALDAYEAERGCREAVAP